MKNTEMKNTEKLDAVTAEFMRRTASIDGADSNHPLWAFARAQVVAAPSEVIDMAYDGIQKAES